MQGAAAATQQEGAWSRACEKPPEQTQTEPPEVLVPRFPSIHEAGWQALAAATAPAGPPPCATEKSQTAARSATKPPWQHGEEGMKAPAQHTEPHPLIQAQWLSPAPTGRLPPPM